MGGNAGARFMGRRPVHWLALWALSSVALFLTWLWGVWSGGLDVAETCTLLKGQTYDADYRRDHYREPSQIFPLHNRCNASYDLVPAWINPALVLLALVAVGSLIIGVNLLVVSLARTVARRRARSGERPAPPR